MKAFKLFLGFLVVVFTVCLIGSGLSLWWAAKEYTKPGAFTEAVDITIERGANINRISEMLLYEGALDMNGYYIFPLAGRLTGQATKLKAGEYEIPAHASIKEILNLLESGKVIQRQVTIREGLTNYEINRLLLEQKGLEKVADVDMLPEGHYLPETYSYSKGDSNADILGRMAASMESTLDELWKTRADNLPFKTKEEALTLASIIEKETSLPEERKRIAGVFVNRLRKGMLLQTDPTVIYAITKGENKNDGHGPLGRHLLKKDLKIDSPYNTYLHPGLPPGPIANPGRGSIEAALHPEENDFLYFVADGSGGHAFAKTLKEHQTNVRKWHKKRKALQ